MARPSDWSPVDMDRDPTPGDPDEVRELADELEEFADDVGEALGKIRGMAGERAMLEWAGLSADAFRREFDGVPDNLTKLEDSYSLCSQALHTYWPKLQTAQGMADRALDRAVTAQADLASAQTALGDATDWVGRAGDEAERLQREGEQENVEPPDEADVRAATRDQQAAEAAAGAAQSRVDDAEERLTAARQLALDAQEMREEAARQCARDIDEASDAGIQNRRWWEKAIKWATDNWDTLVEICKVIVAVLGIVVLIIGGPLAWVVLAAAIVVLADTLIKYARGEAGLLDVAFAALDCIPGMKGLTTLGGLARGLRGAASTGLRGLRQGVRGLGRGIRRMGRGGDNLVCRTDPIDMATGEMVMSETDIELPGVLPLVIRRHHRTSLREGTWFGPSWTSTLDQRLVLDEAGLRFITADGMILDYPRPAPDEPVQPVEGPRWGLSWDGDPGTPLTVHQPETGHTLHFAPVPGRRGGELPLTAITDRNDNHIAIHYDGQGAPTDVVHHGGYHIGITTANGRITHLHLLNDPERPILRCYAYDGRGNLFKIHNSSELPLVLSYDDERRITGWEDRNGTWYRYTYDGSGRCVRTEGIDGFLSSRIAYDEASYRTLFTDSLGNTTVYQFNDSYQLLTETDPLGHRTHRTHDRYDRLLTMTDPLGRTSEFTYDGDGNLIRIRRADGNQATAEYNDKRQPVLIVEPGGQRWEQGYDERGNLVAVSDPLGNTTAYTYSGHGHLLRATDPLGGVRHLESNAAGLPTAVTESDGSITRCTRDPFGRVAETIDPTGGVTRVTWSVEGKPLRRNLPDGSADSWAYDAESHLIAYTDPAGGVTAYRWGPFDLPASRVGPDGARTEYAHDTEGNRTSVTNPLGLVWTYAHDACGRVVSETDFNGRTIRYRYDAAGRLSEQTNGAGQTTYFTRDALGEIVTRRAGDAVTVFERDRLSRIVHASNADAVLTLERDPLGRVIAETCNGQTMVAEYDTLGRRTSRRTPSGTVSRWRYDEAHRPLTVDIAGRIIGFTHDAAGREIERGLVGAVSLTQEWDAVGRLTAQTLTGSSAGRGGEPQSIQRRDYAYRADGYMTAITDRMSGERRFTLDAAGRITGVDSGERLESYSYDAVGNVIDATWRGEDQAALGERVYAGTLVRRAGRTRYEHDAQGRVIRRSRKLLSGGTRDWRYVWDADDRLVAVETPGGSMWRYLYDPLGRRIAKLRVASDGSVEEQTNFVWDGTRVIEQSHNGHTTTWEWEPGSDRPVAQLDKVDLDERFYAIVTDLVGTPTELVDDAGRVLPQRNTTVWGVTTGNAPGDADCPLRFPGQYHDSETGLNYNHHRYYAPETARYQSPDPLGLFPALDHHAYVHNPFLWTDPLGLSGCDEYFSIYRTPRRDDLADELANGPDPANFPPVTRQSGAYFGERSVAAEYQGRRGYADGMVRYDMDPAFVNEFMDCMHRYDWAGPNGTPRIEWAIPADRLARFNELTGGRRTFIPM
ncbi:RHS repeat-associated core domain-containing protein [Streptomyces zhaozhouensis]|uniref:RHS repeat-associated core domain-containing protein n=2 Tax=Streptomyces zhaozhouensis TaxID=1300267 RepID=A0A286DV30_9ACTN|nr:RHS repeat-associated core domain-containing protein [Streptomyces zhaozhouensis]